MAKIVDDNGFWLIKANPITKEGVFPYLGRTISPELEPDKIYQVYRSFEELSDPETLKSFDGVPFINDHEMIGEGFTDYDNRPAAGVLMNPTAADGIVRGDLKIFSEELKEIIRNGKKELSLGYKCEYHLQPGMWNGVPFDAVQKNIRGNHIALVDRGRMGADVRVYDGMTCDAAEIIEEIETVNIAQSKGEEDMAEEKKQPEIEETGKAEDEKIDKRKLIDEIGGILKEKVSEEVWRTVIGKAEELAYNDSESGKATDEEEEPKAEDEEAEKAAGEKESAEDTAAEEKAEEKKEEDGEEKAAEDKKCADEFSDAPKTIKLIEKMKSDGEISEEAARKLISGLESGHYKRGEGADSFADIEKAVTARIDRRNALRDALSPHIGEFACDGMTEEDVAAYGCEKLGLDSAGNPVAAVNGFLAGCKKGKRTYSMDATARTGKSRFLETYLK